MAPGSHALFQFTDGGWSRRDEGVTLHDDRLVWSVDGGTREAPLSAVRAVNIFLGGVDDQIVAVCAIDLGGGLVLHVTSGGAWGGADPDRAQAYRDFVADVHGRLLRRAGPAPAYRVGPPGARRNLLVAVLVIATGFFVVMPLVLLLMFRDLNALWITIAGAALVWPLYQQMERNSPRTYDPARPPEDLFP